MDVLKYTKLIANNAPEVICLSSNSGNIQQENSPYLSHGEKNNNAKVTLKQPLPLAPAARPGILLSRQNQRRAVRYLQYLLREYR